MPEDNYSHISLDLMYTPFNLPGTGCDQSIFQSSPRGCSCGETCTDNCPHHYDLRSLIFNIDDSLIIECNEDCSCHENRCPYRVVQRGPVACLDVTDIGDKGFGVVSNKDLEPGVFVCEYAGEVIGEKEAILRLRLQDDMKSGNYIMVLREHAGGQCVQKTIIDPTVIGNIGRYMNHSCQPNLSMFSVRSNTMVPHLALVTNRRILKGTELCFDYGGQQSSSIEDDTEEDETKQESSEDKKTKCLCDSSICREFLPFDKIY